MSNEKGRESKGGVVEVGEAKKFIQSFTYSNFCMQPVKFNLKNRTS